MTMPQPHFLKLPGVQVQIRDLKDGPRAYYRHRASGVMLGTSLDHAEVQLAFDKLTGNAPKRVVLLDGNAGTLGWLIGEFYKDDDFFLDEQEISDGTRDFYRKHLEKIRAEHGELAYRDIDAAWVFRYKKSVKKRSGRATANQRVSALRRLYTFAKAAGHFKGENPASKPGLYALAPREGIFTRGDVKAFMSAER